MGHLSDHPSLPFSGATPQAKHSSWTGATTAEPRAGSQCWRIFLVYRDVGPHTDHEMAAVVGLPIATICARRNWLVKQGLVEAGAIVEGPHGAKNTRWQVMR